MKVERLCNWNCKECKYFEQLTKDKTQKISTTATARCNKPIGENVTGKQREEK